MEENIALDSQKQKKFVKSIKGIKKLIQKNEDEDESTGKNEEEQKPPKSFSMRLKDGKVKKRKHERGLVYLAHIPHGFYEHQMTQYFRQFGVVTNARVIRSKRTGSSKGYAFVEFKEPSVGEIVAETMNNYLMGKRLIKAAYIPPEKQKKAFRKRWNRMHNPASEARLKMKKAYNADKDESGELNRARKYLKNLNKTKKRLSEMGINYDFFAPVDIPEGLLDKFIKQEKDDNVENVKVEDKKKTKKAKKADKSEESANKNVNTKNVTVVITKTETSQKTNNKVAEVERVPAKVNKKDKVPAKVNTQEQKNKQQKLKDAGVKPAEEFIKVQEESDDSDSSYDFDSDEYDKVLEQDDDDLPSGESEESEGDDEEGDDDEEESEEEVPQKQVKGKPHLSANQAKGKPVLVPKETPTPQAKKQAKQQEVSKKLPQEVKRKAPLKFQGSPKKPKFEKQNQKPMKKQFKKK